MTLDEMTGFWLEELVAPYHVFKDAGAEVTLASPKGGRPRFDPKVTNPSSSGLISRSGSGRTRKSSVIIFERSSIVSCQSVFPGRSI